MQRRGEPRWMESVGCVTKEGIRAASEAEFAGIGPASGVRWDQRFAGR